MAEYWMVVDDWRWDVSCILPQTQIYFSDFCCSIVVGGDYVQVNLYDENLLKLFLRYGLLLFKPFRHVVRSDDLVV